MKFLLIMPLFFCAVAMCAFFSDVIYGEKIEQDLKRKAEKVILSELEVSDSKAQEVLAKADVRLWGHELQFDQTVIPSKLRKRVMNEMEGVIGLYTPDNDTFAAHRKPLLVENSTPNQVEIQPKNPQTQVSDAKLPFIKVKEVERFKQIIISGEVASANEKKQIIAAYKQSQRGEEVAKTVIDKLKIENNVTTVPNLKDVIRAGITILNSVEECMIEWRHSKVILKGRIENESEKEYYMSLVSSVNEKIQVDGKGLTMIEIVDLHFKVERLSNKKINVSGVMADEAQGEKLFKMVLKTHTEALGANEKANVVNNLRYTKHYHKNWWKGFPEKFIPSFLKETQGVAKIEYGKDGLYIEGVYLKQTDFEKARAMFAEIPAEREVYDDFMRVKKNTIEKTSNHN